MSEEREMTWEEMLAMMQPNTEETVEGADELLKEFLGEDVTETRKRNYMDAVREDQPIAPPAPTWTAPSFTELKQALPIHGLAVMLKKEHEEDYRSSIRGITGHIYDCNGFGSSVKNVIRLYKTEGKVHGSWKVKVVFNGTKMTIPIERLEVAPYQGAMVKLEDNYDGEYRYFLKDSAEYYEFIDRRAIIDGYPAEVRNVYDLESQEKEYNEA